MARCDEGYLCEVCGLDVASIAESDLYLRYIIGMLDPESLHTSRERHIVCNPMLAQFIVDERFPVIALEGDFDKRCLDPEFVRQRQELVSAGWRRLNDVAGSGISILEYPLPQVREKRSAPINT